MDAAARVVPVATELHGIVPASVIQREDPPPLRRVCTDARHLVWRGADGGCRDTFGEDSAADAQDTVLVFLGS